MDNEGEDNRFREGTVIAGKYSLTHTLGQGGMGLVVAATHLQLDRRVAIKFLLPQHLEKTDVVSRFTREARSAAKIQSDHVAHVLDVGVDEGTPYMVMEYLEGEDLKQVLSRRGPLSVEEAVRYIVQACEALGEAHGLGIVHRDLKPANLFLANRANGKTILKVLDFGISKIMNPATETELTLTSRAVGSPSYMSPEQLTSSRSLDARADVWALGICLYELLTRRRPFYGETMPTIVAQILKGQFEPLDSVRADLPLPIVTAVHRCLEADPAQRFATVAELAEVLAPFAPAESTSAVNGMPRVRIPSGASLGVATNGAGIARTSLRPGEESSSGHNQTGISSMMTAAAQPAQSANRGKLFAVAGLGALLAVTVGGGVVLRATQARSQEPSSASAPIAPTTAAASPLAPQAPVAPSAVPIPPTDAVTPPSASISPPPSPVRVATPVARPARGGVVPRPAHTTIASPSAAPASAPTCHLVSYFDALGDKHFKQECP